MIILNLMFQTMKECLEAVKSLIWLILKFIENQLFSFDHWVSPALYESVQNRFIKKWTCSFAHMYWNNAKYLNEWEIMLWTTLMVQRFELNVVKKAFLIQELNQSQCGEKNGIQCNCLVSVRVVCSLNVYRGHWRKMRVWTRHYRPSSLERMEKKSCSIRSSTGKEKSSVVTYFPLWLPTNIKVRLSG